MARVRADEEKIMKLLRDHGIDFVSDIENVEYDGKLKVTWAPQHRVTITIAVYGLDPETLINKHSIYLIPEDDVEIRWIIPVYLRRVGADDELVELLTQYFVMAAKWKPWTVAKHLQWLLGIEWRSIEYWSSDPCTGHVITEMPQQIEDAVKNAIVVWKWYYSRYERWRYWSTEEKLELRYSPELNRLILYYDEHSGDFRESGGGSSIAVWPPLGVEIKRTRTRVVCGPDGYATEIHETITL